MRRTRIRVPCQRTEAEYGLTGAVPSYNSRLRAVISVLVNLAVAFAFVQAPFSHVHEHKSTQNHTASFLHAHLPHVRVSPPGTAALDDIDPDDDARPQNWLAATIDFHQLTLWVSPQRMDLAPHWVSEPYDDRLVLSGHDPPVGSCSSPRAPPA